MKRCVMLICVLSQFSCVQLYATPWTVARQAPLCIGFSSKNTGWDAVASSRGPFWPRGGTCVSYISCIIRHVLHHYSHLGSPYVISNSPETLGTPSVNLQNKLLNKKRNSDWVKLLIRSTYIAYIHLWSIYLVYLWKMIVNEIIIKVLFSNSPFSS